jgi:hypothetical protein
MNIVPTETTPQPIMMRAIQTCPDALEEEVAGDFEQAVAEEEQAGADTVLRRAEAEVALELARGEADVHSVDVGDNVTYESERDQPAADAAQHDAGAVGTFAGACFRDAKHSSGTLPWRCRPTNSRWNTDRLV